MSERMHSLPGQVGIALLAAVSGLLLRLLLWPLVGTAHPYITFYPAVMVAGLVGGMLAGLTTSALAAIAVAHLLEPLSPQAGGTDASRRAAFLVAGALMSVLGEVVVRARRQAQERARESRCVLEQLAGAEQELRRHAEELAENNRRKDTFLAMLAHELRNPLAPLRTGIDLLAGTEATAERKAAVVRLMQRQIHHLTRLIDDLLDTARMSQGQFALHKETVPLAEIIETAVELARPLMDERKHTLTVCLPREPVQVHADPVRIAQVLGNLLHNAARYTAPGGRIEIRGERRNEEVLFQVIDTGIGIREELVPRIFELFQRGDQVPGEVPAGLGLGLTLVQRIIELHRGVVKVESRGPGQGSIFEVRLPGGSGLVQEKTQAVATLGGKKRRILIVDDNDDAAQSLAILLSIHGHEVRVANDGAEALCVARNWHAELVILDIGLPGGMDGFEVARQLRQQAGGELRLVALTGFGQAEDRRRGFEAGFDCYLVKPAGPEELAVALSGN